MNMYIIYELNISNFAPPFPSTNQDFFYVIFLFCSPWKHARFLQKLKVTRGV